MDRYCCALPSPSKYCTVQDSHSGNILSQASACSLGSCVLKYNKVTRVRYKLFQNTARVRAVVAPIADLNFFHAVQIAGALAPRGTKSVTHTKKKKMEKKSSNKLQPLSSISPAGMAQLARMDRRRGQGADTTTMSTGGTRPASKGPDEPPTQSRRGGARWPGPLPPGERSAGARRRRGGAAAEI